MSQANAPSGHSSAENLQPDRSQGIQGRVLQLTGDFMPTPETAGASPQRQPVQTTVWVFTGRLPAAGPQWSVAEASPHPQLRQRVSSDAAGRFSVAVPPGEYTLFAQYDQSLHLNAFLGDGSYAPVQVQPGQITEFDLLNRDRALF